MQVLWTGHGERGNGESFALFARSDANHIFGTIHHIGSGWSSAQDPNTPAGLSLAELDTFANGNLGWTYHGFSIIQRLKYIMDIISKQGRPPRKSEKGPYAVVDERCKDTTLGPSIENLLLRHFYLISWTLVSGFTTAPLLPHFLDPSIRIYYSATSTSFLGP